MEPNADEVWKNEWVVRRFLEGARGGIPYANDQIDVMMRLVDSNPRPLRAFLDLGSGSGLLALAILARHPEARATLVDNSEPMMEAARDLLGEDATLPLFLLADLGSPSWTETVAPDGPYDAIVSGFTIQYLPNARKQQLFGEIHDLLAPGGLFVNVEQVASPSAWAERIWHGAMLDSLTSYHERQRTGQTRETIEREYALRPTGDTEASASAEDQTGWLRSLGYVDVDCYFKYFELAVIAGRRAEV
jgi:SAM-dependent methyltransferase